MGPAPTHHAHTSASDRGAPGDSAQPCRPYGPAQTDLTRPATQHQRADRPARLPGPATLLRP
jgi:hypothetical protein